MLGAVYSDQKTGRNFAVHGGLAFSTENKDTDYQNGTVFHLDASFQQLLPVGPGFLGLGIEAFYYQQITDDSGGAILGDFKGRTAGLGPVAGAFCFVAVTSASAANNPRTAGAREDPRKILAANRFRFILRPNGPTGKALVGSGLFARANPTRNQ